MAGPEARAVIAVEILVEQDVIPPIGIALEFLRAAVHRPPSGFIPKEDSLQAIGYFMGDLIEPRNAEHCEECEALDSVQQNGHFAGVSSFFSWARKLCSPQIG
jgi:hypothetical protein